MSRCLISVDEGPGSSIRGRSSVSSYQPYKPYRPDMHILLDSISAREPRD